MALLRSTFLAALALLVATLALGSGGGAPFAMFANSTDPSVFPALSQTLQKGDYVSARIAQADPHLGRRIGRDHLFVLPGSLSGVRKHLGCGPDSPGLVMYDIEHWTDTPDAEQQHPGESIAAAARLVHAAGCQRFGLAPDGEFMGMKDCKQDFAAGLYQQVDWRQVDLLSIQAQRILADTCNLSVDDYAAYVTQVTTFVKAKNPNLRVVTQISLRYTPTDKLQAALRKLGRAVDGYYLIYPAHSTKPCNFCSPQNAATVLRAVHSL
jgi:hypothetical protein